MIIVSHLQIANIHNKKMSSVDIQVKENTGMVETSLVKIYNKMFSVDTWV